MVSATQKTDASRTVTQNYRQRRREGPIWWHKDIRAESAIQAVIGREDYLLSPVRELVYEWPLIDARDPHSRSDFRESFILCCCNAGLWQLANSAQRFHRSAIRIHRALSLGSSIDFAMRLHSFACRKNSSEGIIILPSRSDLFLP
jgi:hypothetical protein